MTTDEPLAIEAIAPTIQGFLRHIRASPYARRKYEPDIADFTFGNPQEMPLPGLVSALHKHLDPLDKDWFAYKTNEPYARSAVVEALKRALNISFEPEDVFMTNGAFAALPVTLRAITNPGDEVIFLSPPWFFYEALILAVGAKPVRVTIEPPAFDLPVEAITAAINERTRAVIINSPHNPTGRIYPPADLERLASALTKASERIGRPIRVISDESYRRIVFDGRAFHSVAEVYPETFVIYTYAKTLLSPGERLGYVAATPGMRDRARVRKNLALAQFLTGFACPNSTLQRAVADLEALSIDIAAIERRRDRMAEALRAMGYELLVPEGTFYMMVRAPIADDTAFCDALAERGALVLPGAIVELPGWFRISLTASDVMVERGLKAFEACRSGA